MLVVLYHYVNGSFSDVRTPESSEKRNIFLGFNGLLKEFQVTCLCCSVDVPVIASDAAF